MDFSVQRDVLYRAFETEAFYLQTGQNLIRTESKHGSFPGSHSSKRMFLLIVHFPLTLFNSSIHFETGSHTVVQAGLQLIATPLPQLHENWSYRHEPPHLVFIFPLNLCSDLWLQSCAALQVHLTAQAFLDDNDRNQRSSTSQLLLAPCTLKGAELRSNPAWHLTMS